ncbi:MAG TPA: hypothetical protein VJZ25_03075 [Gemmatimonadaceae bacterium]|nr:hypothetical protein [Gemmatimonadaceae bacterium]
MTRVWIIILTWPLGESEVSAVCATEEIAKARMQEKVNAPHYGRYVIEDYEVLS